MVAENEFTGLIEDLESQLTRLSFIQQKEQEFALFSQQRYHQNLAAFEHYQPSVAASIKAYQPAANFRIYVTPSGYGNFVPSQQKVPLYSDDPIAQTEAQVEKYCDNATYGRMALYQRAGAAPAEDPRIHISYMFRLMNVIAEFEQSANKEKIKSLPLEYPSCLVFGIGLGYHIPMLLERCHFDYVFVCEPDYELFYASLFCIDWAAVLQKIDEQNSSLVLHLGIPYSRFFHEIQASASQIGAFSIINSFCYQHYPSKEINQQIKAFFEQFYRFQNGFGFFDDALNGFAHMSLNLKNKSHLLLAGVKHSIHSLPAFVVANGPSLDASLDFIKAHQHQAIVIAAGTGLQTLLKVGVVPDFHVLVERTRSVYEVLINTTTPEQLSGLNLLSVEVVYPDTVDCYQWAGLGLKGPEASTFFLKLQALRRGVNLQVLRNAGPLVANTALAYATTFGFKEIYLFGVDNGTPESLNSTHSKHSIYNDARYAGRYKPNVGANMTLPGNLDGVVKTSSLLAISKLAADEVVTQYKNQCNIYNVGHGAKIENAIPLHEDDLFLVNKAAIDKSRIVDEIKAKFFTRLDFSIKASNIAADEFDELIDYLVEINQRPIESRRDASDILKSQSRVVYAYQQTANVHLFHMLKGSLLYFHCPLITLLYTYKDDLQTLDVFRQSLAVWNDYLVEMKSMYRNHWQTKCALMPAGSSTAGNAVNPPASTAVGTVSATSH